MTCRTLLDRLGELERETNVRYDPRWEHLARGDLPHAEAQELRSRCERAGARPLLDAFAPLDAAAHERLVRRSLALLGRRPAVVPVRPRSATFAVMGTAFCAAAAAIVLAVGLRSEPVHVAASPGDGVAHAQPAASTARPRVPRYELEVSGGDELGAVRAAADAAGVEGAAAARASTLGAGTPLSLVLRPESAAAGPVEVAACAARGGEARPWPAAWERSERGAFRIEGTRESLFPAEPAGEVTLVLAVGAPGALPSCEALAHDALAQQAGAPPDVAVLTHRVLLR